MRIRSRLKEEWMKTQRNKVGRNYSATLLGKVEILKKKKVHRLVVRRRDVGS